MKPEKLILIAWSVVVIGLIVYFGINLFEAIDQQNWSATIGWFHALAWLIIAHFWDYMSNRQIKFLWGIIKDQDKSFVELLEALKEAIKRAEEEQAKEKERVRNDAAVALKQVDLVKEIGKHNKVKTGTIVFNTDKKPAKKPAKKAVRKVTK